MSKVTPDEFIVWLDQILQERGWTDYRLSIEAGISHSVISRARAGQAIGFDASTAIANALNLHPYIVLAKVGLVPPLPDMRGPKQEEMNHVFASLDTDDQDEVLQLARMKLERKKRGARGKKQDT
jgi:hypothetical protein